MGGKGLARFVATAASVAAATALAVATGCSERAVNPASRVTLRDSAGIRIVESSAPEWTPGTAWAVEPTPVLSIGSADGAPEYQLTNVSAVVELSDGRIVVADGGGMQLRTYTPDGRFIRAVGGRGQGPGEFSRFTAVTRYRGDSIFVHDFGQRRFTVITAGGAFGRTGALQLPPGVVFSGAVTVVGTWDDGSIAVIQQPVRTGLNPPQVTRRTHTLYRYAADGTFGTSLDSAPGTEYYESTGGMGSIMRLPFGRRTTFVAGRARAVIADDQRFELRVVSLSGRTTELVRIAAAPESVTAQEAEVERERLRAARAGERARSFRGMPDAMLRAVTASEEETYRIVPAPPTYPAFGAVIADDDGFLWVERYAHPATQDASIHVYAVIAPDGRWLGDVRLPARFLLSGATVDHVIGIEMDDLDVPYVRVYRISGRR